MATDLRLKEQLPELTKQIVQTYQEVGSINHLGHCPLPNYDVIISCCEELKELIYPGFRRREGLHMGNVLYHVGELIDSLHDKLTVQIGRALRHDAGASEMCTDQADFEALGQVKAVQFLEQIPEIRKMLALDVQAAYDGDPAVRTADEIIFCYPGLEAVTIYRLAHALHALSVPFIPRMMTEWAHSRTGIDIHPGSENRRAFFHRSWHRRGHWRDDGNRQPRQTLPRRHARCSKLSYRRRGQSAARPQAAPHDWRSCHRVRQRHDFRRPDRDRPPFGRRLERLANAQRRTAHDSGAGSPAAENAQRSGRDATGAELRNLEAAAPISANLAEQFQESPSLGFRDWGQNVRGEVDSPRRYVPGI